jgi:RND family efflux transporter MFP subunit
MNPAANSLLRRAPALLAASVWCAAGCRRAPQTRTETRGERERVTPVRVAPVERVALFRAGIDVTGTVTALQDVRLVSKVPGRLERLMVREGDRVTAGQPVALIERRTLEVQLQAAKAGMDVARAQAAAAEAGLHSATTEVRRLRTLFKKGSVTQQQLDGAETAYRAAVAQRELTKAQIAQLAAQLEAAKIQLDECTIRSPMDGIVVDEFDHTAGEMIAPQVPVLHVAAMRKVRVVVRVSEEELGAVAAGRDAQVSVARHPGRQFAGRVLRVSPTVDVRSRTAKVEILVDNPVEGGAHALKPGMFARARITTAERSGALVISEHAIQDDGDARIVFVVDGERAHRRVVRVAMTSGGRAAIAEGLAEGEMVVIEGATGLPDGARISSEEAPRD